MKKDRRGIGTLGIVLIVIGIVIILAILIIAANVIVWMWTAKFLDEGAPGCLDVRLSIKETSAESNSITITRLVGGAEVSVVDFRIIVNGEVANIISPEDKSLEELDTKTYVVGYDIETGDTVKAAPVVQTGENQQMTCDIVGETKAI